MNEKKSITAVLSTTLICWVFWLLITGQAAALLKGMPSLQVLLAGGIVSLGTALFSARFFIHRDAFFLLRPVRLLRLLAYCCLRFPVELIRANIDVALRALRPSLPVNPGIVRVPVGLTSEYAQAMLADSITLTPGTITMDIAEADGQVYYYVHWIDVKSTDPEEAGEQIKGILEKKIRGIWE